MFWTAPSSSPLTREMAKINRYPQPPYPFSFKALLDSILSTAIRTGQLTKVPQEINQRLHGCYFGWYRVGEPPKKEKSATDSEFMNVSWQQVVISALSVDESTTVNVKASNAFQRKIAIRFIEEVDHPSNVTVEVQIMRFIRLQQSFISSPTQAERREDESAAAAAAEHLMLETFDASITQLQTRRLAVRLGHQIESPQGRPPVSTTGSKTHM
jgi:hypothetical protein